MGGRYFGNDQVQIKKRQEEIILTVTSLTSIFIAVVANFFYNLLQESMKDHFDPYEKYILLLFIAGSIILIYIFSRITVIIKRKIFPDYIDEYYMKHAFLQLRNLGARRQEALQKTLSNRRKEEMNKLSQQLALDNMQLSVQCCYDFFESVFTDKSRSEKEIRFEVTFMTESYKDWYLTIPCSANKEGRLPHSMLLRKSNPKIYASTETAKIYRMQRPVMILIEDTSSEAVDYKELYKDQKERIKSAVILPVLSHSNELLGTLAVHCNRAGFFRKARYQFWNELLEMFAAEIGYYKKGLDYYNENRKDLPKPF